MSLFKAETRRLTKRRFTRFFTLGVVLVLLAVAAGMFLTNKKTSPEVAAQAQAKAEQEYQRAAQQYATDRQACEAAPGTPNAQNWPANCDELYQPQQTDFDPDWFMPATFKFVEQFPEMATVLAALLAAAAFVIGATFVGAEWHSGGMMNLLLWRPKRVQVVGTKLTALLVGLTGLTVVLSALWTGAFVVIAQLRGSTEGLTAGAWQSIALTELRGLVLVLVAGTLGFGLASIGRHTAVAMGAAIGAIVVLQAGLGTVLQLAKVKFIEAYLAPSWITAWMDKRLELEDYQACDFSSTGGCEPDTLVLTWQQAGAGLTALVIVAVAATLWAIRSRDIT